MHFLSDARGLDSESTKTKEDQGDSIQLCKSGRASEPSCPETQVVGYIYISIQCADFYLFFYLILGSCARACRVQMESQ